MQNLYEVLQNPTKEKLALHSIKCFNPLIEKYPKYYKDIIAYINDVFNYNSPLLIEEKDWGKFLMERFDENNLHDSLLDDVVHYESEEVVRAMSDFLEYQKQPLFTTYTAKQNLRLSMLGIMQKSSSTTTDKKNANEMVSSLDAEIAMIIEKFRQGQKIFGNFAGYDQLRTARNKHLINVAQFID